MTQLDPLEFPGDSPGRTRSRTIGARLKDARASKRLTLEQAERDTRISSHYLEALESGQYEVMPAPVYARGFMRSYADYLDMDPAEAVMAMPDSLPPPDGLEPIPGLRRTPSSKLPVLDRRLVVFFFGVMLSIALVLWNAPSFGGGTGLPELSKIEDDSRISNQIPPFTDGTMPDLKGVDRVRAIALLEELGLEMQIIETANINIPAGQVFQQAPEPKEAIATGELVTLVISLGAPAR